MPFQSADSLSDANQGRRSPSDGAASRPSNDNRLRALEDRAAKIKAQIAAIEARQASRNRKDETRTKVLVGAAMLADSALHEETRNGMRAVLARAITAPRDRDFLRSRGLID